MADQRTAELALIAMLTGAIVVMSVVRAHILVGLIVWTTVVTLYFALRFVRAVERAADAIGST